jgi:hypothetical protein
MKQLMELMSLPIEEKRVVLKEFGDCETSILVTRKTINRHKAARDISKALVVERLIPCILHMKMRMLEKIFQCLVNSGLERYADSKLDKSKRKLLASNVEIYMKGSVMGNSEKGIVSYWKFKWKKPTNVTMEKVNFSGGIAQKILLKLHGLVRIIFDPEFDQEPQLTNLNPRAVNNCLMETWIGLCENLVAMWALIEQKDEYTNEEIMLLHKRCNNFMSVWTDLFGNNHVTNYIHIVGAGHLSYFAKKYGNLYRYSQQGWESMNQLLKHYYFNNTNHGGSSGNGGKDNEGGFTNATVIGDHCRPLMKLCQRTIMWKLGIGDAYFQNKIMTHDDKSCGVTSTLIIENDEDKNWNVI